MRQNALHQEEKARAVTRRHPLIVLRIQARRFHKVCRKQAMLQLIRKGKSDKRFKLSQSRHTEQGEQ